ncbi:MAG: hypothetical protein ACREDP_13700, partial [Bradyrhizobium sp.]
GADRKYFLPLLLFVTCFRRACPGQGLLIADFGLTSSQRTFLRNKPDIEVLDFSGEWLPNPHVWHRKAALIDYLGARASQPVMWLDSDALVFPGIVKDMVAEASTSDAEILACPDGMSISGFINKMNAGGGDTVRVFASAAADAHLPFTLPYLSSGIFLCRSAAALTEWRELAWELPTHVLFEQNAFNLVARRRRVKELDRRTWNCSGANLDRVVIGANGAWIGPDGVPLRFAHFTTDCGNVTTEKLRFQLTNVPGVFDGRFRMPANPPLRTLQRAILNDVVSGAALGPLDALMLSSR